ncbi:MAG: diguanylate cyclase, partial [Pseudomonadota bacterium]
MQQEKTETLPDVSSDAALIRRERQLHVLSQASLELNRVLESASIFRALVEFAVELVGAEGGWAGIYEDDSLHFTEYHRNGSWRKHELSLTREEHIAGWIIENKMPYTCYGAADDPLVMANLQQSLGFTTLVALPIVSPEDDLIAYLEIHDKQGSEHFDDQDLYMLMGLVAGAAIALSNAIALGKLHDTAEELSLMARFFENSGDGMIITDELGRVQTVNDALTQLTGHHTDTLSDMTLHLPQHFSGETEEFLSELWNQIQKNDHWQGEIRLRHKDGHSFPAQVVINSLKDKTGSVLHYTCIFSDLSNAEKVRKLEHLAHHDTLTGLPNRLLFHARLSHALEHAKRKGTKLAVLFLDLDGFKAVNDTHGHDMGDLLLKSVARRLQASVRSSDTVA